MPECTRCQTRITNATLRTNHNYCDTCLTDIGREVVSNNLLDLPNLNELWRNTKRVELQTLITHLNEIGSIRRLTSRQISLAETLGINNIRKLLNND